MKKWWAENKEEVLAGLFLLALFFGATGVILQVVDNQASRVRTCQQTK